MSRWENPHMDVGLDFLSEEHRRITVLDGGTGVI